MVSISASGAYISKLICSLSSANNAIATLLGSFTATVCAQTVLCISTVEPLAVGIALSIAALAISKCAIGANNFSPFLGCCSTKNSFPVKEDV